MFDRLDYTTFAHRRINAESHESDQAEIGYFVVRDPDVDDKMDLVRREESPIDRIMMNIMDVKRGGVILILAENIDHFDLKYLDPLTGQWVETWDSTELDGAAQSRPARGAHRARDEAGREHAGVQVRHEDVHPDSAASQLRYPPMRKPR